MFKSIPERRPAVLPSCHLCDCNQKKGQERESREREIEGE